MSSGSFGASPRGVMGVGVIRTILRAPICLSPHSGNRRAIRMCQTPIVTPTVAIMIRRLATILATLVAGELVTAQSSPPAVTKKLTLGCESCGTAQQFGSIWDLSISPAGDILVTDRDAPMLRRFDA